MSPTREEVVEVRIKRAKETLDEARDLAAGTHWFGTLNRIYYACFYAVSALLHAVGYGSKKHSGVLGLFALHIVKPGLISKDLGRFYNRLHSARQDVDYVDFASIDPSEIQAWLNTAGVFVEEVTNLAARRLNEN